MQIKRRTLLTAGAALAGTSAMGFPALALAQKKHKWKIQVLWGAGEDTYGMFQTFCENVTKNTQGVLEITPFAAGAIVGTFETLDAVSQNVIQGHSTYPGYFAGKEPALAVIGDFSFGYTEPSQQDDWLRNKGGIEMIRQAYDKHNAYTIGCTWWGVESLTSKVPLHHPDDFKGLKHRGAQGLAAETIAKMGASIVVIPGGEAYSALEKGVVDTVDWSTISVNEKIGFFEIAKYATYPGFHSMPIQDLTVNKSAWAALPDDVKATLLKTWDEFSLYQVDTIAKNDVVAAERLKGQGVELIDWSQEDRLHARKLAHEVWGEWAKKSALAKQAVESQQDYLREIKLL
ncbi:MAG: TRAP transporter substrate-binding protein [Castellaniella sp.]